MKYTIQICATTESKNGKEYKKITTRETGDQSVSVWPDFSQYKEVKEDAEIEGVIVQKDKYFNLIDEKKNTAYVNRSGTIREAQERKAGQISEFQKAKEESIQLVSASRDATLIMVELMKKEEMTEDYIKEKWTDWRKWFLEKYNEPFV